MQQTEQVAAWKALAVAAGLSIACWVMLLYVGWTILKGVTP